MQGNSQWSDFLSACRKWGEWTFMQPKYMRPRGFLGLEEPDMTWENCEEPWWAEIAAIVRHWNVTAQYIHKCLHPEHGWGRWEQDHQFDHPLSSRIWYTFKCVFCLIFLRWRTPNADWWKVDWIDVAAYNLGQDYEGEAQGDLVRVGQGILSGWYVEHNTI